MCLRRGREQAHTRSLLDRSANAFYEIGLVSGIELMYTERCVRGLLGWSCWRSRMIGSPSSSNHLRAQTSPDVKRYRCRARRACGATKPSVQIDNGYYRIWYRRSRLRREDEGSNRVDVPRGSQINSVKFTSGI